MLYSLPLFPLLNGWGTVTRVSGGQTLRAAGGRAGVDLTASVMDAAADCERRGHGEITAVVLAVRAAAEIAV